MTIDEAPDVRHRTVVVEGVEVFYRETRPDDVGVPALLLLHGFPSGSHQFRGLQRELGSRFRVVAPDYPGFGHSDAPMPESSGGQFPYTFDHLADIVEGFCQEVNLTRFVAYLFDFGGPIGMRVALRRSEWIAGLVMQNANVYEEGLTELSRGLVAARRDRPEDHDRLGQVLTLEATRSQYLGGVRVPELVSPDSWTLDQHFLELPGRKDIQLDLAFDYRSNVELYPEWQAWLRAHQPPTMVVWGRGDQFFAETGAYAYRRDLPDAEIHVLDSGHFALEDSLRRIAALVGDFVPKAWREAGSSNPQPALPTSRATSQTLSP